jgi:hypothetical protein
MQALWEAPLDVKPLMTEAVINSDQFTIFNVDLFTVPR